MDANAKQGLAEVEVDDDYDRECRRDWIFLLVIAVVGVLFFLVLFGITVLGRTEAPVIEFDDKVATVGVGGDKLQQEAFDGVLVNWEKCRFRHGK